MEVGLSPAAENGLLIGLYVFGVALRIFWPYILAYLEEGVKFDIKYVFGQFIGAIIGLLGVLAGKEFLADLGAVGFVGAVVAGYGAASIGRDGQKTAGRIAGK